MVTFFSLIILVFCFIPPHSSSHPLYISKAKGDLKKSNNYGRHSVTHVCNNVVISQEPNIKNLFNLPAAFSDLFVACSSH